MLGEFATHAETGEPMPEALRDRLLAAATYDMGFQTVEYVASALVDLALPRGRGAGRPDAATRPTVLDEIGMPHAIGMRHATPHFAHVFAGDGYSVGLLQLHVVRGDGRRRLRRLRGGGRPVRSRRPRERLEELILSAGGAEEADALYTRFRGRMPGVGGAAQGPRPSRHGAGRRRRGLGGRVRCGVRRRRNRRGRVLSRFSPARRSVIPPP